MGDIGFLLLTAALRRMGSRNRPRLLLLHTISDSAESHPHEVRSAVWASLLSRITTLGSVNGSCAAQPLRVRGALEPAPDVNMQSRNQYRMESDLPMAACTMRLQRRWAYPRRRQVVKGSLACLPSDRAAAALQARVVVD